MSVSGLIQILLIGSPIPIIRICSNIRSGWRHSQPMDPRCCFAVPIIDDELALLRYYRTLGTGPEHSTARYFMTEVLAEHLVSLRVRYLLNDISPFGLNNGLRHFQGILGFRIAYTSHRRARTPA